MSHLLLSSVTPLTVQCHTFYCPVSHLLLSSVTPFTVQCHTSYCPVSHFLLSSVTSFTVPCHTSYCPVSHLLLSNVTPLTVQCHTSYCPVSSFDFIVAFFLLKQNTIFSLLSELDRFCLSKCSNSTHECRLSNILCESLSLGI